MGRERQKETRTFILKGTSMDAEDRIINLLNMLANPTHCKSCQATIWWVQTRSGKNMPVNNKGESHFADCPNANFHRKGQR